MGIVIAFLMIWFLIACLMILNRSADKIWESMIIVTVVMVSSLFFVLKPEKVEQDIFTNYFYNIKSNDLIPVRGTTSYMFERMLLRQYFTEQKDKNPHKIENLLLPLLEKSVIDWFCMKGYWPSLSLRANIGNISSFKGLWTGKTLDTKVESITIPRDQIKELLKGNVFANYFLHPGNLVLPKGMAINVNRGKNSSELIFKNWYCTITIRITFPVGGSIIQSHFPIAKFLEIDEAKLDGTYVALAHLNTKANFSWLLAGNPEMSTYKIWVKDKFSRLREDFEWETNRKILLENIIIDLHKRSGTGLNK